MEGMGTGAPECHTGRGCLLPARVYPALQPSPIALYCHLNRLVGKGSPGAARALPHSRHLRSPLPLPNSNGGEASANSWRRGRRLHGRICGASATKPKQAAQAHEEGAQTCNSSRPRGQARRQARSSWAGLPPASGRGAGARARRHRGLRAAPPASPAVCGGCAVGRQAAPRHLHQPGVAAAGGGSSGRRLRPRPGSPHRLRPAAARQAAPQSGGGRRHCCSSARGPTCGTVGGTAAGRERYMDQGQGGLRQHGTRLRCHAPGRPRAHRYQARPARRHHTRMPQPAHPACRVARNDTH